MTTERWIAIGSGAAVAGAFAFLAKLAVLAATDGQESVPVATLYFLGIAFCAVGSSGIALRLLRRQRNAVRVAAVILSPLAFFGTFLSLDSTLVPLTRDHLPKWAEVEAGVFVTALIWLTAGAWALRTSPKGPQPAGSLRRGAY